MRDINVCKKCDKYCEDVCHIMGDTMVGAFTDKQLPGILHSQHWCMFGYDHFIDSPVYKAYKITQGEKPSEYYDANVSKSCPFYAEHLMFSLCVEEPSILDKVLVLLRIKRRCQHCGIVMWNKKKCDRCGYDRFRTRRYYGRDEKLMMAMWTMAALCFLLLLMMAFRIGVVAQ